MVEAAIEFADICRQNDYHNFVFSMKASNPLVMAQGYRRLAAEMYKRDWDYPLHLGVTEASTRVSIHRAIKCRVSYVPCHRVRRTCAQGGVAFRRVVALRHG